MQTWGQNYWETYAPIVNWASVWILLAIAKIHGLLFRSIDFVLAFPQADLDIPVYMELPLGFDAPNNECQKHYVLHLNKSLYGLKQAGYNWFAKLSNGLQDQGFVPSSVDPYVFFGKDCIVLTYVDDCIIVAKSMLRIDELIKSLHRGNENFVLQDEGSIDKYLGVNIKQIDKSSFELSQPLWIPCRKRGKWLQHGGDVCGIVVLVVHGTFHTIPTIGKLWSKSFLFPPKSLYELSC
jgi:hypothetical protein